MSSSKPRPVVVCILDGWGHSEGQDASHNAIMQARTPHLDALNATYGHSLLEASELHVGLPDGQMGNSEVGHMSIGSGRIIMQDLPRIDHAIATGSAWVIPQFNDLIARTKAATGTVHVLGLLSPGGVHSHQAHFAAFAKQLAAQGLNVCIHALMDGRDTPPSSALEYLAQFERDIAGQPGITITTAGGRYYGMDRDNRWERVGPAYHSMTAAHGERFPSARAAIEAAYAAGLTDEFIKPSVIGDYAGMQNGDSLLCINFRADRVRQMLTAFVNPAFTGFPRERVLKFSAAMGMVEYSSALAAHMEAFFPPESVRDCLGEVLSRHGLTQLRIAETEKYPHVTYFFNGGNETEFTGEKRILVPSPKVATYDLQPEMSAPEVTEKLLDAIARDAFDVIVVNYANTDMVGHTGNIPAARAAVEAVDACVGRLAEAVLAKGGIILLSADHGNAEHMYDHETEQPHTAHTLNRVPFAMYGHGYEKGNVQLHDGTLADIAPTVLALLGLPIPAAMTGKPLFTESQGVKTAHA